MEPEKYLGCRASAPASVAPSLKSRQIELASCFCSGSLRRWLRMRIESPIGRPEACSSSRRVRSARPDFSRLGVPPLCGFTGSLSAALCFGLLSDFVFLRSLLNAEGFALLTSLRVIGLSFCSCKRWAACRRSADSMLPVMVLPSGCRAL